MPIKVDEAYLNRLVTIMRDLSAQTPAASGGEIDHMNLRTGHNNFFAGQQLSRVLQTRGGEIQQRLAELGKVAGTRSSELWLFINMTDDSEDISTMTAEEFGSSLPSWSGGGGGPTGDA
ncbi:MAG: hypothetical protein ACRDT8_14850 [Micromonosporaceae bacterium]